VTVINSDNVAAVTIDDKCDWDFFMMRLRIHDLIDQINRDNPQAVPLHIRDVAAELGLVRSTLGNVTSFTGQRATNTRIVEALIRYFSARIPNFDFRDLFEFRPPIGQEEGFTAEVLYPALGERRQADPGP
jgi:hypothetical protein